MAGIRLHNVRKTFGRVVAVRDLTLTVPDQEFIVLLGPSGCGKTTLLRCVAGLERVDRGSIFIGDREVTDLPPRQRHIAMVFQSYAIFPHLTVFENIAFGLRMQRRPTTEITRRVHAGAELLQISDLLDRYPAQLSGGQRQRVAVARALVMEPQVLLLDEPLSNLDAKLRLRMRTELKRLHKAVKSTTLYVTHDQVEAMSLADRVAVMHQGELLQVGTPQEIYETPADTFVAGFIGSPPMNFLRAHLDEHDGILYVRTPDFALQLSPEHTTRVRAMGCGPTVILGLRPQDMHPYKDSSETTDSSLVRGVVDVVEPLGDQIVVTIVTGQQMLQATLPAGSVARPDQPIILQVNLQRIHLFDPETERAIL